jgi:hypothetical protein
MDPAMADWIVTVAMQWSIMAVATGAFVLYGTIALYYLIGTAVAALYTLVASFISDMRNEPRPEMVSQVGNKLKQYRRTHDVYAIK